ncbi:MAG: nitroreductase family protein [Acidobacteriota bacterium]
MMSKTSTHPGETTYPEKPANHDYPINELIKQRWSPRLFEEGRTVEPEKLMSLLEAARWAPSCFNEQPWYYLVFDQRDPAAFERARQCLMEGNAWAREAPLLLLSVAKENFSHNGAPNRHAQYDTGAATGYMVLQAVELGLMAHQMAGYDAERARSEFQIPEGYTPMAMIAIGYPFKADLSQLDDKTRTRELGLRSRRATRDLGFLGVWGKSLEAENAK